MHDGELWQEYRQNGEPLYGVGHSRAEFANNDKLCATAHLWIWRHNGAAKEVFLQKRSMKVEVAPGKYSATAAGHLNLGETPTGTLVRETTEEIGIAIDPSRLWYAFSVRQTGPMHKYREFKHVYLYEYEGDLKANFNDGEAESVEWVSVENLKNMFDNGDLARQTSAYYQQLFACLDKF
ncbi:MAG: NUDIX domain-containing protein [Candidatus Nomurabacteria bacterium]|nr:NUDIX domain-containing protein [Candidatus Nomurabacteria bacterium]